MNFEENIKRLQAAEGDPQKLALATVDVVMSLHSPELRSALEAAAVPHWFDARILGALLEIDAGTANKLLGELQALPMVETFAARGAWNVHEATRLSLRNMLAHEAPERLQAMSKLAVDAFVGEESALQVESIYHRLLADPKAAPDELERLWKGWDQAGRHEPLQALGLAIEELIRMDHLTASARARALLRYGSIRSARLSLRTRKNLAFEAMKLFQEQGSLPGELDAHDQLGEISSAEGRLADALQEFRASQQIARQLIESDPTEANWHHDLSVCHNKVGMTLQAQGHLDAALAEYQADKEISVRLIESHQENTEWHRDLSVTHNSIGGVLQAQGKLAEALSEYETAKKIRQRLTERDRENTDWQQILSVSHNRIGLVLQAQGNLAGALLEYEAYRGIMQRLAERDPENTGWQRDLSVSHYNVGNVLQAQGELDVALAEYQAGKLIMLRLAENDPENTDWQSDLATSYVFVGSVMQSLGDLKAALVECEAALRIAERLATIEPANVQWQDDLAVTRAYVNQLRETLKEAS